MSTGESTRPLKAYVRDSRRRKMAIDLDLNDTPPVENRVWEEASTSASVQGLQPIDVDAIDDEVLISSQTSFDYARSKSRKKRGTTLVLDEDLEIRDGHSGGPGLAHNGYKRHRRVSPNQTIINCDVYINLEGTSDVKGKDVMKLRDSPQHAPIPPKEPTFNCPVCMGPLVEPSSTKCGHIFCENCIKQAIRAQKKCPTCRMKLTMRGTIRIYLPSTS